MAKNLLAICLMFIVASSVIYEVQGTFLLKLYLRKKLFPRRCVDFTPFANKGMLMLMGNLERGCPATAEFKEFFANFKAYMSFISSVSVSSSSNIDVEMNGKANALFKSCSVLDAVKGGKSSSVSSFKMTMLSMGKTLIEQKRSGSKIMTIQQRKELVIAMVKWTRMLATFVKTASEKRGKSIDISSYGLDVDVSKAVADNISGEEESSTSTKSVAEGESSSGSVSSNTKQSSGGATSTKSGSEATYSDATGAKSGSPSGSPSGSASASGSVSSNTKQSSGGATSTKSGSEATYSDATGAKSGSPRGSPSGSASASGSVDSKTKKTSGKSTYADTTGSGSPSRSPTTSSSGKSYASGESSASGSASSKTKESAGARFSDTTGGKSVSPTASPSGSETTKTTGKGSASSGSKESKTGSASSESKESKSSSTTSVKQVETETSSEVMSFISNLEKKYTGNAELKVFFEKLKTSMSASSKISSTNAQELVSGMKSAAGKLFEAMVFVRSRFSKSAETKTTMETCQEEVMKSLKELQEINGEIASAKTVTSTQKTELKQTITKWEQVTTQFVETAASSSSSSSSSSSQKSSGSSQQNSVMSAQAS